MLIRLLFLLLHLSHTYLLPVGQLLLLFDLRLKFLDACFYPRMLERLVGSQSFLGLPLQALINEVYEVRVLRPHELI